MKNIIVFRYFYDQKQIFQRSENFGKFVNIVHNPLAKLNLIIFNFINYYFF